ncbi:phage tail tape measure protein [Actinoplanes sp. CA-054009]
MALKLGELVTYLKTDDTGLRKGLDGARGHVQKFGQSISAAGPVVGAAVGTAIAAGLAGALSADAAKAKLTAQLGDGEYADSIGRVAGNVYARGFGESAAAVAETLRGILTSGLVSDDATDAELEDLTVKAQTLADVFGQDVVATARAAGQMVKTGLADNATQAFDILTRGFQQTGDLSDDFLDTVIEYGVQFEKLGLDGAAATGLLSQGLKAGARDADTVADALKEFSILALDGNKNTLAAFKDLGLNAGKVVADLGKGGPAAAKSLDVVLDRLRAVEDPVKQSQMAVALFGTKAEDLGKALYSLDPSTAAKGLGEIAGASKEAGDALEQSASQKLESFKRQAQLALIDKLAEAIPYIEATFGWLQKNSGWVTPLATGLGILAGVIAVVAAAQWAWNAAQLANPTTWIILGILALVAGLVLLVTKTQFFQTIWAGVWGFMKAVGAWFAGPFANFFVKAWSGIVTGAKWVWDKVAAYFGFFFGLYAKIGTWTANAVGWVTDKFEQLVGFVSRLPGRVTSAVSGMWDGIKSAFKSAINWVISKWNNLSFGIPGFSIAGMSIPGVNVSTPDIPYLAQGGIVPATRGGRLTVIGEGGEDEAVAPLSRLASMISTAVATGLRMARSTGGGDVWEVHVDLGDEVRKVIRVRDRDLKRRAGARGARGAFA